MPQSLPLPKYHQIYLVLREQLEDGRFAARVPAELDLVKEFGVARVTVRRALEQLVAEGLIERSPGRGTVTLAQDTTHAMGGPPPRQRAAAHRAAGEHRQHGSAHRRQGGAVRGVARVRSRSPDNSMLARDTLVQKAVRVRSTGDGPLSHITTYVPQAIAQRLRPARAGQEADPDAARRVGRADRPGATEHLGPAGRRRRGEAARVWTSARRCSPCSASCST